MNQELYPKLMCFRMPAIAANISNGEHWKSLSDHL